MTIEFQIIQNSIVIAGDTFRVKDQIKAIGGKFDWTEKYWKLPHTPENLQKVEEICGGAAPKPIGAAAGGSPATISETRPAGKDTYTISQVATLVAKAVERAMPSYVWVTGEVQNLSRKTGPRGTAIYFSLAEPKEGDTRGGSFSLQATVWGERYASMQKKYGSDQLESVFADGIKVRMRCKVTIYKDRGQVSLQVSDIDPAFTQGALALARQKTLAELRRLGLDQKQKKLRFDPWSGSIGLITAEGSRAYGDFAHQYASGKGIHTLLFASAASQGEATRSSVIAGIDALVAKNVGAIVLTRGGGSAADLRWFDDIELCKAVCNAPVPVFAAIGHHDDVCVAEEVCFQRAKTPTAAAAFFVQNADQLRTKTKVQLENLGQETQKHSEQYAAKLKAQKTFFARYSSSVLDLVQEKLLQKSQQLKTFGNHCIESKKQGLLQKSIDASTLALKCLQQHQLKAQKLKTVLAEVDPAPWLEKGWALLSGQSKNLGNPLDISKIAVGEHLRAHIQGGSLDLTVDKVKPNN